MRATRLGRYGLGLAAVCLATEAQGQASQLQNLSFGTVIVGTNTDVAVTSANAAMWRIHVSLLSALGGFSLTLPTTLARAGGGTGMPISFCSTCGRYALNSTNAATATTFNPATSPTFSSLGLGSDVYIWLGGRVSPPANQAAGSYSGTIVLTTSGLIL